jgi:L-ascorbate metabolism protein UlaG (beta-lactamase superfamily)
LGHASVLLESKDCAILIDPIISYKYPSTTERYTYEDLPDFIDYVLITHGHQDHLDLESLLQLRYMVGTVVVPRCGSGTLIDPSLKLLLKNIGFQNVEELDEMDYIQLKNGTITAIPFWGEHSDLNVSAKACFGVRLKDKLVLCMADSCNLEPSLYNYVHKLIGDVDVLFIGMECEGSPLSRANSPYLLKHFAATMDESRRTQASNHEQAIEIVQLFNCKQVYVYAMGLEPWLRHLFGDHSSNAENTKESFSIQESNKLIDDCRKRGVIAERVFGKKEIILRD